MPETPDVIIIGGSFAGLAAALYLARARRNIAVLDSGQPRNRYSAHSHGVFALDGQSGSQLLETARSQLLAYPTAKFLKRTVGHVAKKGRLFEVESVEGEHFSSRRLILASGVVDELPNISGLKERWGKSVFHCPYCDGYEIGGGAIGVLATLPLSIHFAKLITDWGDVTLFTNKAIDLDAASRQSLVRKGVRIEELPIAKLKGNAPDILNTVVLNDGTEVRLRALFIATLFRMVTRFAKDLGCELIESPRGTIVKTDESKMTSVPGVYAAGDMARLTHSIPFATSDGVTAGVSAHQSPVTRKKKNA